MKIKDWLYFEKDDLDRQIRNYPKFRLFLFLTASFGLVVSLFWFWEKTSSLPIKSIDLLLSSFLSGFQSPSFTKFFSYATLLGEAQFIGSVFLLLTMILIIKRRKRVAAVMFIILVASALINVFLRNFWFGRIRPNGCISEIFGIESCFSFPSGHALWSFYFYGLLDYLIFRFLPVSLKTYFLISFLIVALVGLISFSRLYLGVHYFSDIVGGLFLGGAWLVLAILLIDIFYLEAK